MLEIGTLLNGTYKILSVVGRGGMSVVYLAINERANKTWAVKEVRKDGVSDFEVVKQGLIVETEMLKQFNHPHLPSIVDVIDTEKPENSSQSEMYSGSDSSARATKYPFYVTLETSDGLMLGQHVYIEPGTGVNTEGLHLMTAYIVDADGKEPYVWVANKKDRLEKRNVKLGAYDEEQDTWEITEGLKETDYIVWPDGECKEGAAVQKNENVQAGGMEEGE